MTKALHNNRGLTLIELVVTMVILGILGALILPSAQMTSKRVKEIELRRNLREIRTALDEYKRINDKAIDDHKRPVVLGKSGYPESLQVLLDGDDFNGYLSYKRKFLRKVPQDPFHPLAAGEKDAWGLRSMADSPDSSTWGGEDVFDVYSLSEGTAIDGTKYKDW